MINIWSKRNLTVIGKTLILPILNHLFLTLPNPSKNMICKLNSILFTYIWNSPTGRIKREIIQKDFKEGGLK